MAVRVIDVRERVMAQNDAIAEGVRHRLYEADVAAINLMSSPGAGKTLLLERTLADLGHCHPERSPRHPERSEGSAGEPFRFAVIVGDIQTQNDADRLARHTTRLVHAVVTGGACHLDARQVAAALEDVDLDDTDLVFIENVGNLVCPASWSLGETANVVLFATTEGEDKPLKYPKVFQRASCAVITKVDLLPHLDFDLDRAIGYLRDVNPNIDVLLTSARTGEGLPEWYEFVSQHVSRRAAVMASP
jgi:hydrogenase nickel incorporation protein HypB